MHKTKKETIAAPSGCRAIKFWSEKVAARIHKLVLEKKIILKTLNVVESF